MKHNAEMYLLEDGRAAARPLGYLGSERYREFKEGCADGGFTYDSEAEAQCGEVAQARAVAAALKALGIKVRATRNFMDALNANGNGTTRPAPAPQRPAATTAPKVLNSISIASPQNVTAEAIEQHIAALEADYGSRGLTLYPFQMEGVRWLSGRQRSLYADEMGLGKTISALSAIPYGTTGVLVVCPAHLKGVWRDEAAVWRPDLELTILKGLGSFRWPKMNEILVINYDILPGEKNPRNGRWTLPTELQAAPSCIVIADEAHYVKSREAARAHKFRAISKAVLKAHGRVILLTGTPLIGNPEDLWNVLRAARLELEAFDSWPRFLQLFEAEAGRFGLSYGQPDKSVPGRVRRVMKRRLRKHVLPDLPEKSHRTLVVDDIDAATRNICEETVKLLADAGVELTPATESMDLRHNPLAFYAISAARTALAAAKIPFLIKTVEEFEAAGEPLVVFAAHRPPIDVLGARPGWATITGDVKNLEERADIAREFREGKYKGISLTVGAGGTGLTLCGGEAKAAHMLFVSRPWDPSSGAQCEDRLCRIGQTRGVLITDLVADHPVDRRIWQILTRKADLIDATLADDQFAAESGEQA